MDRKFNIGFKISKVDDEQRRVWGVATSEDLDSQGDILDYEASKAAVNDWMKIGNIREMHDGNKAIGKAFEANFDDTAKSITVGAYVSKSSDGEDTWTKVKEGILTGYSVGGKVLEAEVTKVADGDGETVAHRITKWAMSELSLVDNPANPKAQLVMVKSKDGNSLDYIDVQKFIHSLDEKLAKRFPAKEVSEMPVAWWVEKYQNPEKTKAAIDEFQTTQITKRKYSDKDRKSMASKGQALPDGSFPIKDKEDLSNAIHAYGRASDKAAAKSHIMDRAKALGATDMIPADWKKVENPTFVKAAELRKDFFGVSSLTSCAMDLTWFRMGEVDEGDTDSVNAVDKALAAIKEAIASELSEVDDEEVVVMAEAIEMGRKAMDLAKKEGRIRKAGAAVVDGDPRNATSATVTEVTPVVPNRGGTPVTRTIVHADNTKTTVTKLKDAGFSDDQIEKIVAATALPDAAPRKNNPAADDPEAKRAGEDDDDPKLDDSPSTETATDHKSGEPSDGKISDSADGAADAPTPAGNGADTDAPAADPKAAEAAAATSDPARRVDDNNSPKLDDSPTEDDDEGKKKAAASDITKIVSDQLDAKLSEMTKLDDVRKAVSDLGELTKKVAGELGSLNERLTKIEKTPLPSPVKSPAYMVEKGREGEGIVAQEGLSESEIVAVAKRYKELERNPLMGTPQERGDITRKVWKIKDFDKYLEKVS